MARKAEARKGGVSVPYLGGALEMQRIQRTLEVLAQRLGLFGVLADPSMSIAEIVALQGVGGSDYKPLRVLLPEGTWSFGAAGVTVSRSDVHFEAIGSGRTVFQRTVAATTAPMLTLAGSGCRLAGVRVEDASTAHPAIKVSQRFCRVLDCFVTDCWRAFEGNAATVLRLADLTISAQRDTTYQVLLSGNMTHAVVSRISSFSTVGQTMIRADDGVTKSSFSACTSSGLTFILDYKTTGATGNVEAANVGVVNAR